MNKINKIFFKSKDFVDLLRPPKNKQIKFKSIKEVRREFQKEEWNILLKKTLEIKNKKILIQDVDQMYNDFKKNIIYYSNKSFYQDIVKHVQKKYIKIFFNTIQPYLNKESKNSLVELGSGYGSKICNLAIRFDKMNYDINYFAGEISSKGRKITDIISNNMKQNIKTFEFSYFNKKNYNFIPKNSIVFSSYSMPYMKKLDIRFFKYLSLRKPKVIINFEPFFESHNADTQYGMACRNYIIKNDYCRNHLSYFKKMHKNNKIVIINYKPNIYGSNPMLPISQIEWRFLN